MKNATLRQLRVFSAVARHLSFVRAAEELGLTAPAVSMQIKELEIEVGHGVTLGHKIIPVNAVGASANTAGVTAATPDM